MSFLELHQVSKSYGADGSRTEVLRDINLHIEEGEFVAIVGYSGAGKTTLMSILAGLLTPDTGSVKLEGREVDGPGPDRGIVFQNYSLLPWLTVFENVKLGVDAVFADWPEAARIGQTEKFIAMVHLADAHDKRPAELSGGMRQRVSVARTLAMQPKVLLCDEPLSALDALTRANLQDEIARIRFQQKQTVVLVTNDPDEAILLADRVIPLTAGPGATLGPSFPVDLPHPRDRRELNHNGRFKELRREVTRFLLALRDDYHTAWARKVELPDLDPDDLDAPRSILRGPRRARRRDVNAKAVELNS